MKAAKQRCSSLSFVISTGDRTPGRPPRSGTCVRPPKRSERIGEADVERALPLVEGVLRHRQDVDERISRYAENYELGRLATVDRNILRLAIYEMLHRHDIPPVVSINEAIEIAKRFGTEESSRFVNGILDRVKLDLDRPLRTAGPPVSNGSGNGR